MNLNEYEGPSQFRSPSSTSHSFILNTANLENVYIFVIDNIQSFTSQMFGVVRPLRENLDIFTPLRFDIQTDSDQKTKKIKALLNQSFKMLLE